MGVVGQRYAQATLPTGMTGSHCIGSWVCPKAGLDMCGKSRPQPEFDSRTVASRYTDFGIRPTYLGKEEI
jgi:hypothetical protein